MTTLAQPVADLLAAVLPAAESAGVFGACRVEDGVLRCAVANSAEPAEYRVFQDEYQGSPRVWVALVTEDRWLSGSIEGDLVHTGDKIEELIDEEFVDLDGDWGGQAGPLPMEHFRSEEMLFTFRSPLPFAVDQAASAHAVEMTGKALLAFELAFRPLGDMDVTEEDD